MSDRNPGDEPKSYEPTAELRPEEDVVIPLGEADELGTADGPGPSSDRPASTPIVISSTPEPSSLTEARRIQAKQRIDERRGEESSRPRGEVPMWVWLAAGILVLLLAVMFFASRGSDDEGSAGAGGGAGTLEAGGTDLFSLAGTGGKKGAPDTERLRELEGSEVTGGGVQVQSVVSDEGLWVGTGPKERFFVFLDIEGESGPDIKAGDSLRFSGELRPVPVDFKERFGLAKDGGAKQLREQSFYAHVTEEPEIED